ncbi:MAG: 3-phosphoshikimate 1-carboxyvinyltransferase [Lachnospiraceae bacterium]|nr:3-phosphoshikimate 1-carboxyvinyltransferase [Lachnospiraceae bacterium]
MNKTINPGSRSGIIRVPASKSWAHRMMITAALSENRSRIYCDGISKDIAATAACLNAMGAKIEFPSEEKNSVIEIEPVNRTIIAEKDHLNEFHDLYCGESGSTLRFLIPVVGVLGIRAVFHMEGRLSERPLGTLVDELLKHGMCIEQKGTLLYCSGKLMPGEFYLPGNISSQYISGLLMALPLASGKSSLTVTGKVESGDYIEMTERAVKDAGAIFDKNKYTYIIEGNQKYKVKDNLSVEKDWSSAAFPLCMGAFSEEGVTVYGLNPDSGQGDKEIINILKDFGAEVIIKDIESEIGKECAITVRKGELKGQIIDASGIPDLVPVISAVASGAEGETRIIHAERLRFKESDRLMTTSSMLRSLGADIEETEDGLKIRGKEKLIGGTANSFNDHRIAMSAAVAAGICTEKVTILDAECTDKSFPGFWDIF